MNAKTSDIRDVNSFSAGKLYANDDIMRDVVQLKVFGLCHVWTINMMMDDEEDKGEGEMGRYTRTHPSTCRLNVEPKQNV